jgi:ribosomal protein L12E/L44/L45/RPP1/RPP2
VPAPYSVDLRDIVAVVAAPAAAAAAAAAEPAKPAAKRKVVTEAEADDKTTTSKRAKRA